MISYLRELALVAGKIALAHFQGANSVDYTAKGRSDFVSFVDRRVEDELRARIHSHYPDHAIVGEEREDRPQVGEGPCWIIDPIDGTTNFIRGIPFFCTSIAFCEAGRTPKYAMVVDPVRQEVFIGERNGPVWVNERRCGSSQHARLEGALVACALPFRVLDALDEVSEVVRGLQATVGDMRRTGSAALDLAYTAVGRLDAYWELGIWPWDSAAGELLVRCGGGRCSDFRGEEGALLTRRSIVAAASPALHAELLAVVGPRLAHWLDHERYAAGLA
jgi:myo-inositol-1(or 4)-monophosphatase